ncbi:MAG: PAS domain-containing protein [Rhodospirillaceae bacterium]|nr:PAS domain-containing protein [Rhodospirillaceae bacterium]
MQQVQFDADDADGLARGMAELGMSSPLIVAGFRYWNSRRLGRKMPLRSDLDPIIDIPSLVPHIILFDVRREPLDFRFRLVGSHVRQNLSRDYAGHWFSEFLNYDANSSIWPRHKLLDETGRPMLQRPNYVGPNNDFIYVENILLPLGVAEPGWSMQLMFIDFIRKPVP